MNPWVDNDLDESRKVSWSRGPGLEIGRTTLGAAYSQTSLQDLWVVPVSRFPTQGRAWGWGSGFGRACPAGRCA